MTAALGIAGGVDVKPVTVREALSEGTECLSRFGVPSSRLDAELLLCQALGCGREELYITFDTTLGAQAQNRFRSLLGRRVEREPVSYITGHREFWSLDFVVTPEVLVPRPETELLVEVALGLLGERGSPIRVLDIGTGSGAVAVSLASERWDMEIWATDLSSSGLEIACENARRNGVDGRIQLLCGDLFAPIDHWGKGFFHLIASNPPYVRRGEIDVLSPEVRNWEPRLALDGGEDGLDFYRRICLDAHCFLADGGFLALEIGADARSDVLRLLEETGCYSQGKVYRDNADRERVIAARKLG